MKKLEIITRPEKLVVLKDILVAHDCNGMTIFSVMGCGTQRGLAGLIRRLATNMNLLSKMQVNAVVADDKLEPLLADIQEKVATGRIGDGKVFIFDVPDAMRIRTGERGLSAIS